MKKCIEANQRKRKTKINKTVSKDAKIQAITAEKN